MSKHIKISYSEVIFAYLCLGIIFFLANFIYGLRGSTEAYIEFLKYSVVFTLLLNVGVSIKVFDFKLYHPYLLFLGTLTFFILSRVILDIVYSDVDFARTNFLSYYVFEDGIKKTMLLNLLISLLSLQTGGALAMQFLSKKNFDSSLLKFDSSWRTIGLFFFYLGLPFLVYQYYQVAREVLDRGYMVIHDGTLNYSNSLITVLFSRLSWVGFFVFLASVPPKKSLYFNLFIFILVLVPRLLQGARGPVMCISLVLFWYVMYVTQSKLKVRNLMIMLVAMFFVNVYVGSFRTGEEYHKRNHIVKRFLYEQGVSIQVLGYSIEHDESLAEYSFINMFSRMRTFLDVAKRKVLRDNNVMSKDEIIEEFGYIGFWITNQVNRKMFLQDNSIGGSYLAEFYLVGKEAVQLFGSLLIGFLTVYLVERWKYNRIGLLMLLFILPSWIYIPRDSTFNFITDNMSNIILFGLISVLIMFVTNNKDIIERHFKKSREN